MNFFDEEPEDSDLQRLMSDLKKKGWGKGRLDKMEQRWDRTMGWGAWHANEQERRASEEEAPPSRNQEASWDPVEWDGARYRIDPPNGSPEVIINCAERVHLCKAVCCKLNFALTPREVREGKVKWDRQFPYLIAHGEDGYCAHLDHGKGCDIFSDRPALCRRFDCRTDGRVWKDFEAMIPNSEWIEGVVSNHERVILRSPLPVIQVTSEELNQPPQS